MGFLEHKQHNKNVYIQERDAEVVQETKTEFYGGIDSGVGTASFGEGIVGSVGGDKPAPIGDLETTKEEEVPSHKVLHSTMPTKTKPKPVHHGEHEHETDHSDKGQKGVNSGGDANKPIERPDAVGGLSKTLVEVVYGNRRLTGHGETWRVEGNDHGIKMWRQGFAHSSNALLAGETSNEEGVGHSLLCKGFVNPYFILCIIHDTKTGFGLVGCSTYQVLV